MTGSLGLLSLVLLSIMLTADLQPSIFTRFLTPYPDRESNPVQQHLKTPTPTSSGISQLGHGSLGPDHVNSLYPYRLTKGRARTGLAGGYTAGGRASQLKPPMTGFISGQSVTNDTAGVCQLQDMTLPTPNATPTPD